MIALVQVLWGVVQLVAVAVDAMQTLYAAGLGLRWLFSPVYRREVRDFWGMGNEWWYVSAALMACLFVVILLGWLAYSVARPT